MKKIKILAIVGSLRKESYNLQLAQAAKQAVGDRADFEILDYADVPFMSEDIEFPAPESVKRVRDAVKAADGIWFFTPEYNHYFSGVLKNLTDWLSRKISDTEGQVLSGKPAAVSGIGLGITGTAIAQDHLVTLLNILNAEVMNVPRLTIPNGYTQLDSEGKLALTTSEQFLNDQADAFVAYVSGKRA